MRKNITIIVLVLAFALASCQSTYQLQAAWGGHVPDSLLYLSDTALVILQYDRPDIAEWSGVYLVYQSMDYEPDYVLESHIDTIGLRRGMSAYIVCHSHNISDTTWIMPTESLYVFPEAM